MKVYVVIHNFCFCCTIVNKVKGTFSSEALAKERVKCLIEAGGNTYHEDDWYGKEYCDFAKNQELDTYTIETFDLNK